MGRRVLGSTLVLLAFAFFARPRSGSGRRRSRTPRAGRSGRRLPGPEPKIHGPTLTGCRPGRPFLYLIPCTGTRPLRSHAERLPAGLSLDADRGILRGTAPDRPESDQVTLHPLRLMVLHCSPMPAPYCPVPVPSRLNLRAAWPLSVLRAARTHGLTSI